MIWLINQRALYNHALSIIIGVSIIVLHWHWHLYTPPPATGLYVETLYLVHICTYAPHL